VGNSILQTTLSGALDLYSSVTEDTAKGIVYVKMVNTSDHAQTVKIDVHNAASISTGQDATAVTLVSANPMDTNSILEPTKIVPVTTKVIGAGPTFTYTFQPYSVTVLMLGGK
jgi:alpha-N-arabinofuranosidase